MIMIIVSTVVIVEVVVVVVEERSSRVMRWRYLRLTYRVARVRVKQMVEWLMPVWLHTLYAEVDSGTCVCLDGGGQVHFRAMHTNK